MMMMMNNKARMLAYTYLTKNLISLVWTKQQQQKQHSSTTIKKRYKGVNIGIFSAECIKFESEFNMVLYIYICITLK